jgi:hypothetical protein
VGVKTRGCSGNQFALTLAKEKGKFDEEVAQHGSLPFPAAILMPIGVKVWVENAAIMKILVSLCVFSFWCFLPKL